MKFFWSFLFIVSLLTSCKKNNCGAPSTVEISNNGPIVEGWDLHLETQSSQAHRFNWYGPGGWKIENQTISTEANQQTRTALTAQDAGEYRVEMINSEGCVEYKGSVNIEVIPPPSAPCNVAANTSSSSTAGIGNYTFINRSFVGSGNFYTITGSAGGAYIRLAFPDPATPKPGVYTIANTSFGLDDGEIGIYFQEGGYDFGAQPGGKVYLTRQNDKLSVTFCSVAFSNPLNPSVPVIMSANITQP